MHEMVPVQCLPLMCMGLALLEFPAEEHALIKKATNMRNHVQDLANQQSRVESLSLLHWVTPRDPLTTPPPLPLSQENSNHTHKLN